VLAVAVEVDDDVGAVGERCVHAVREGRDEPAVPSVVDDAVGARGECDRLGPVGRAVVDDDHLDLADPVDPPGYLRDNRPDRLTLV
jgi:hypothetical protein